MTFAVLRCMVSLAIKKCPAMSWDQGFLDNPVASDTLLEAPPAQAAASLAQAWLHTRRSWGMRPREGLTASTGPDTRRVTG